MEFWFGTIIVWLICGAISASLYKGRGRSESSGFILGFLLGPIGVLLALFAAEDPEGLRKLAEQTDQDQLARGEKKKCPYCAEFIKPDAVVCRYCGRDLPVLEDLLSENRALQSELGEKSGAIIGEEASTWKAAFQAIGWMEVLGSNSRKALDILGKSEKLSRDGILCTRYADSSGGTIREVIFKGNRVASKTLAFLATSRRLMFVDPKKRQVGEVEFTDIADVEYVTESGCHRFLICMKDGSEVVPTFQFPAENEVNAEVLINFMKRIARM